jgi:hypothetical protein
MSSASTTWRTSRWSYLYTQPELAAAGILPGSIITEVGWMKANTASSSTPGIFRIFMKNSTTAAYSAATETWANLNAGTTLVYENLTYSIPATAQPNYITFTLNTPFTYTGGSWEIGVEWDASGSTTPLSNGSFDWVWSTVPDRIYGVGGTTLGPTLSSATVNAPNSVDDRRPFIQITYNSGCTEVSGLAVSGVTTTSANLSWSPVPSSTGYEYVINTSATPPATGAASTSTNYAATGLTSNTTYYFHVRNKCSSSFSAWKTISFTTDNVCASPTNIVATITGVNSADISWDAMPGSIGYEYVISNSATNPTGAGTPITANSFTASGLLPTTTYYVHVRNKCGATSFSTWKNEMFITKDCKPTASIDVVNIAANTADLVWSPVNNARSYQYLVNTTRNHPTSGAGATTTSNIIINLNALMPGTKYFVHVRAECFVHDSSAWTLDSFVTKGTCTAPDLQVKKAGEDTLIAKWTELDNDYSYEYSVRNSNLAPVYGVEIYTPTTTVVLPADNKSYYMHVRRKCDVSMEYSGWSTVLLRAADVTGVGDNNVTKLKIYPNPVNDKLIIENGVNTKNAKAVISNVSGQVLSTILLNAGLTEIDMTSYAAGVYFVKYSDSNGSEVIKVTKQ